MPLATLAGVVSNCNLGGLTASQVDSHLTTAESMARAYIGSSIYEAIVAGSGGNADTSPNARGSKLTPSGRSPPLGVTSWAEVSRSAKRLASAPATAEMRTARRRMMNLPCFCATVTLEAARVHLRTTPSPPHDGLALTSHGSDDAAP